MAAIDPSANPSFIQFIAFKLGKALDRSTSNRRYHTQTMLQTTIRIMLHIVGFSCLTLAGFVWSIIAGLVVAGFSCFVLSALLSTPNTADSNRPQQTLR